MDSVSNAAADAARNSTAQAEHPYATFVLRKTDARDDQ